MTDISGNLVWILAGLLVASLFLVFLLFRRWRGAQRALVLVGEANDNLTHEVYRKNHLVAELTTDSDLLRAGIDGLGAAIWDWDLQTRELYVSDLFLEMTGHRRDEFPARLTAAFRLIHADDYKNIRSQFKDYLASKIDRFSFEMRLLFQDGQYHWVHARALINRDQEGRPIRIVGSMDDISERVLAEEERDRLFNLSVDMLAVGGFDGSFHQLNPAWVRVLGWSRDDILGERLLHFIHRDDRKTMEDTLRTLQEGEPVGGVQSRFRCRDGSFRWLSWSSYPYPDHQLIFSVVRDVTEQKEAETKLLEYQDRLRFLSSQLALVEDRQRQQLATAIHDGLAQQLFGIRAKVTLLKYPDKLQDYQKEVQETLDILDDTMKEARNLSFELFPPVLHEVGLEGALSWLANQFQIRTGLECKVLVEGESSKLPKDLRAMAYQSVRELLNNVYKHAEATEVLISLNYVPGFLTLLVDDNGVGFEVSREQPALIDQEAGFGLFSIRERLRSVGGRMLVDSRPGQGCRVFLSIPRDS